MTEQEFDQKNTPEIVRLLDQLFISRRDTFARQMPDGSYKRITNPLTPKTIEDHLHDDITLGPYQISNGKVIWNCWDLDGENDANLQTCIKALHKAALKERIPAEAMLLERSGRRGYHLWLFYKDPVPLTFAHEFAIQLVRKTEVPSISEGTLEIEVFPKQSVLPPDGFGNLVKLPLGIHQKSGNRALFVSPETFKPVSWEVLKSVKPWSPPAELIKTIKPPTRPEQYTPLLKGDYPCWVKISEGKIPEGTRHHVGVAFASHLRDRGIPFEVALDLIRKWWERLPQPPKARTPLPWRDVERAVKDSYRRFYHYGCKWMRNNWPTLCSPEKCPISKERRQEAKGRPRRMPAIAFRVEEATDRIELCNGEYNLEAHGPHTVIYSLTTKRMISNRGKYLGWDPDIWESFTQRAREAFRSSQLDEELEQVKNRSRHEWIQHEIALIDDDYPSPPDLWGLHIIEANYSRAVRTMKESDATKPPAVRKHDYIRVSGKTYGIKNELKKVGLDWDPGQKIWAASFGEPALKRVARLLKKHDRVTDPVALGLVRCWVCKSWIPESDAQLTEDRQSWYCGCLERLKVKFGVQKAEGLIETRGAFRAKK